MVTLYVDQYGDKVYATSVKDLHRQVGGARPAKMYVDQKDGTTLHIGYVVGRRWFTAFQRIERPA